MTQIGRKLDKLPAKQISKASEYMKDLIEKFDDERKSLRRGGGEKAINRQHQKNRLTARERVHKLIDANSEFFELGLFAAWGMYKEYGTPPGAGVVAGIGKIQGRDVAIIANDATMNNACEI